MLLAPLIALVAVGCSAHHNNTQPDEQLQVYKNAVNNYSFTYSSQYKLFSADDNGYSIPATDTAGSISVKKDSASDAIFGVNVTGLGELSENSIKSQFGATNPADISIRTAQVGGSPGYEAILSSSVPGITSNFYFVKDSNNGVLAITVDKNNPEAQTIFESLVLR